MTTYVAFLRAINVGGRAVVRMDRLMRSFTAAGCENVRTMLVSGNVLFDCPAQQSGATFKNIRSELGDLFGQETHVVFRRSREIQQLVARSPFGALANDRALKLYVAFLASKPAHKTPIPLHLPKEALELIAVDGADALIVSRRKPNGMYGFPNNFLEKELGVVATTRNWTTVSKIAAALSR